MGKYPIMTCVKFTGTHFTRSELEIIIKNNKEEAASQPADETKDFQLQQERHGDG